MGGSCTYVITFSMLAKQVIYHFFIFGQFLGLSLSVGENVM